jgi:hypothetical protein
LDFGFLVHRKNIFGNNRQRGKAEIKNGGVKEFYVCLKVCTVASIKSLSSRSFRNFPLRSQMKNFACLLRANVSKTPIKTNVKVLL